ncbi:UPF0585 protein CG18661 isoform X2 [Zeugodacus cucurbitae]|nr:UPF0585 protein CG18661 isoform X2 [Zeugodacus cucurbitae]
MSNYRSLKQSHPSADRNCIPISEQIILQVDLKSGDLQLLEISSGSGQHAAYLAPLCPNIKFYPSEFDRRLFPSIKAYADDCNTNNILEPLYVDISANPKEWTKQYGFKSGTFDYMLNFNMLHISPWSCAIGLFRSAGYLLKPSGKLFTYGPYKVNGILEPESNVNFDQSLKNRNIEWGIRDIEDLKKLAEENNIELVKSVDMPVNNKFLTWMKRRE